jgi:hypothetical protein
MAGLPVTPQTGGNRLSVKDEISVMTGHFILLALVLVSVYSSRVPFPVLKRMRSLWYQVLGLLVVIGITACYGWIHGILAVLAYALVVSRALRSGTEGMTDFGVPILLTDSDGTSIVTDEHRWFSEKVLGENPFLVREKEVKTSAVQDLSERNMGTGYGSPSSK